MVYLSSIYWRPSSCSERVDYGYTYCHFLFQEDMSFPPMIDGFLSQLDKHVTSEVAQAGLLTTVCTVLLLR